MLQYLAHNGIFACMMFIWTYVYLNRSKNKINQAFLLSLSFVMAWMLFNDGSQYFGNSIVGLLFKTVYWITMMNLSVFFLFFVYRLMKRKLDGWFIAVVGVNTLTIIVRYCFPINYSESAFWRLSYPIVAPLMSFAFTVPAIYALYLLVFQYVKTKENHLRSQLRDVLAGLIISCIISVISEYILPVWFNIHVSLMNLAILVLMLFLFHSIFSNKLLSVSSAYLYERLLSHANDGIVIVNKKSKIICINERALRILQNDDIHVGDKLTDYIPNYSFLADYHKYEITLNLHAQAIHLLLTQHSIEGSEIDSNKLLTIVDITKDKKAALDEKERLIEKTYIDPLTSLNNKLCFIEKYSSLSGEIDGQVSALLFLDIDGFKDINDTYGHLNGDIVLQLLAEQIKSAIGSKGIAFRFGGDEFLVLLQDTTQEEALKIAENIRVQVNRLDLSVISSNLRISLSIGLMQGQSSIHEMMRKADIAMYDAKRKGKNTISVFSDYI